MDTPCPIRRIVKRNGSMVAYDRSRMANAILKAMKAVGQQQPDLAERLAEQAEAALLRTYGAERVPTVEDIQDVVEAVLVENRLTALAREYIIYRHQHAMARAGRSYQFDLADNVPYRKLYEVLRWNIDHRCDGVETLNGVIRAGRFADLVKAADERFDQEVELAAARVLHGLPGVRIAIVAGPSSSGKTTTTIKIGERLARAGVRLKAINIDHYFFDLATHPRDEFGDYDYETPKALDLALINRHLAALLAGETVRTPDYDFKTGRRTMDVHELSLGADEVLLIDSLHGLYEAMTESVPASRKLRIYVEALGQFRCADGTFMRWADNRLLRRMIRDAQHRNYQPIQTLTHWHYVRRSELKHIIPYIRHADCVVNTALPYELPILKARLFRTIAAVTRRYRDDPARLDAHIRANRVCNLLRPVKPVRDDACIGPRSLLREFIGGSEYRY